MRFTLPLLAVLALLAGCGGSGTPKRSAYASDLARLCTDTRTQIERLGSSQEQQLAAADKRLAIGKTFIAKLRGLTPAASERAKAQQMVGLFGDYWRFEPLAIGALQKKQYGAYQKLEVGLQQRQREAEDLATALGAAECARQPFSKS